MIGIFINTPGAPSELALSVKQAVGYRLGRNEASRGKAGTILPDSDATQGSSVASFASIALYTQFAGMLSALRGWPVFGLVWRTLMRIAILTCGILLMSSVEAAEDYRVMQLEQQMRTVEREVQELRRQLFDLQQRSRRTDSASPLSSPPEPREDADPTWLKIDAWKRVRVGMSELEVIEILGKPTALRPDADERRALVYTLEIGTMSFLTGSVSFDAGKVVLVQTPSLR